MELGADPAAEESGIKWTPLHFAAASGSEETVSTLVELGAALDCQTSTGETPLHRASCNGREGAARVLLEAGAASSLQDDEGRTALHGAAEMNKPGVVRILLQYNCPRDTVGPLLLTCKEGGVYL